MAVDALDIMTDRELEMIQYGCNLALGMTPFQKSLNLVSFFLGKMSVIAHRCL